MACEPQKSPKPAKKKAPAGVAAPREQVSSEKPSTAEKVPPIHEPVNVPRAVASGGLAAAGRTFGVAVLSDGEHVFRFASVSDVFGVAPDHRHFGRTIERIYPNSQGKALRPIEFVEASGGGRAMGITSAQFVVLLRAFIQRGMDGKLKGKQAQALAGAWAVASALMAEGVDSMIDAALGIARTPEGVLKRAAAHFEREIEDAKAKLAKETDRAASLERQLEGEKSTTAFLSNSLERFTALTSKLTEHNEQLAARVAELEELAARDGTVGEEWVQRYLAPALAYIASLASEVNGKSKRSNRRKIENKVRGELGFVRRGTRWANFPATPMLVSNLKVTIDAEVAAWKEARREMIEKQNDGRQLRIEIVVTFDNGGAK